MTEDKKTGGLYDFRGHRASSSTAEEIIDAELALNRVYMETQQMDLGLEAGYDYQNYVSFFDTMGEYLGENFNKHWQAAGPIFQEGGFSLTFEDMEAHASGDVGFVSMIQNHDGGRDENGKPFVFRTRVTDGLRKIDGKWKIVHEHISFAVDLVTSKAIGKS